MSVFEILESSYFVLWLVAPKFILYIAVKEFVGSIELMIYQI